MSATLDLIINGLLGAFGTVEIVGIVLFLVVAIAFLLMNFPIPAVLIIIMPLAKGMANMGWISNWVFAVILMLDGLILFFLIKNIVER